MKYAKYFVLLSLGLIATLSGAIDLDTAMGLALLGMTVEAAPVAEAAPVVAAPEAAPVVAATPESKPAPTAPVSLLGDDPAAPESKPGDKPVEGEQKPADKTADAVKPDGEVKPKAPEKYEITAPEGVQLNAEVLGEFEGIAREFDLTQESAQKVADIGVKLVQRIESQNTEAINALWTTWADQSRADTEFGGAAFEKNLALTRAARDRFGTPQFAALLKQSPLSNHPEMIRFLYRVGKATSEDTLVGGDGNGAVKPEAKTAAQVLYPEL